MTHDEAALVAGSTVLAGATLALILDSQDLAWACVIAAATSAVAILGHYLFTWWRERE